jgi:hypothetical protein
MNLSRRVSVAAALALAFTLVLGTAAYATTTYAWFFGSVVVGSTLTPGQQFTDSTGTTILNAADAADPTTVSGANLDAAHPKSVYFPGWEGVVSGGTVSKTDSMLSTDVNFETNSSGGLDGGSNLQDPESAPFSVSAWIKPDDPALFDLGGDLPPHISPNIVQKGVSGTPGGFWKLSTAMLTTSPGAVRHWFPFCEFKNGTTDLNPGWDNASGRFAMAVGTAYKVECVKSGASATVNVYTGGSSTPVYTRTLTAAADFSIANGLAVSVGHKPASTDPRDVYAGVLDNLNINKG